MASRDDLQQPNKTCFADMVPQQYYDVYCQVCVKNYFLFQINVICVIFTGSISYSCNKKFCVKFRFLFVISQFTFFNFLLKEWKKKYQTKHTTLLTVFGLIETFFTIFVCIVMWNTCLLRESSLYEFYKSKFLLQSQMTLIK